MRHPLVRRARVSLRLRTRCSGLVRVRRCGCSARKVLLSRAYLKFNEPEHVLAFKLVFDGHVFVTTKGTQFK